MLPTTTIAEPSSAATGTNGANRIATMNNNHSRAKQRRDRVELGSQDGRNFHYEDGAHYATANSCKHAEQYRRNRAGVKGQRLTRTSNRKERESGGIEYQHRAA